MKNLINDLFKLHKAISKESQFNKKVALNMQFQDLKKRSGLFFQDYSGYLLISGPTGTGDFQQTILNNLGKITPIYKKDRTGNVYRDGYKYENYCK